MTRSSRRAATGTHYTPRPLAEEVAEGALQPLVYRPGPLETSDQARWRIRPSTEIEQLRVADIAMGSGAFLVAACRYLADRLVEAWRAEGRADALAAQLHRTAGRTGADAEAAAILLEARRRVAEHCLYGVDINPLAVEMAKLSLWLITMDRERPFGFLDDRLVCGDSLLGLVNVDQLETLHVDPADGRRLHQGRLDFGETWRSRLAEAADLRRRITTATAVTIRDIEYKHRLLEQAEDLSGTSWNSSSTSPSRSRTVPRNWPPTSASTSRTPARPERSNASPSIGPWPSPRSSPTQRDLASTPS